METENDARGGARCKIVGRCFTKAEMNVVGSNLGSIASFAPVLKAGPMVTFMA